ncbi:MAG: hypothetical protein QOI11_331 [Candidatus Eremiobacteraeota bacterium]|jgi:hypothetical protein|nr:hypothetical protein [Candidatus Eremiobacteraeota bacterium]
MSLVVALLAALGLGLASFAPANTAGGGPAILVLPVNTAGGGPGMVSMDNTAGGGPG